MGNKLAVANEIENKQSALAGQELRLDLQGLPDPLMAPARHAIRVAAYHYLPRYERDHAWNSGTKRVAKQILAGVGFCCVNTYRMLRVRAPLDAEYAGRTALYEMASEGKRLTMKIVEGRY